MIKQFPLFTKGQQNSAKLKDKEQQWPYYYHVFWWPFLNHPLLLLSSAPSPSLRLYNIEWKYWRHARLIKQYHRLYCRIDKISIKSTTIDYILGMDSSPVHSFSWTVLTRAWWQIKLDQTQLWLLWWLHLLFSSSLEEDTTTGWWILEKTVLRVLCGIYLFILSGHWPRDTNSSFWYYFGSSRHNYYHFRFNLLNYTAHKKWTSQCKRWNTNSRKHFVALNCDLRLQFFVRFAHFRLPKKKIKKWIEYWLELSSHPNRTALADQEDRTNANASRVARGSSRVLFSTYLSITS